MDMAQELLFLNAGCKCTCTSMRKSAGIQDWLSVRAGNEQSGWVCSGWHCTSLLKFCAQSY